jgi:hypothetical protein
LHQLLVPAKVAGFFIVLIIELSTQEIRNRQTNITALTFVYYAHLLNVSIQLDHTELMFF